MAGEANYRLMTEATGQRIAAALENLAGFGSYLTTADIVNNLTSTATNQPLSANMGKTLEEHIQQSTASLILSGDVANGETKTLLPVTGGSHILILSRKNNNLFLAVAYDQWSEGYSVVAGAEKSGVTITKGTASAQIMIVNTVGYAFGYKLI